MTDFRPARTSPYLVQRIRHRLHVREDDKGVDRFFAYEYMGSSEFEWGALGYAIKEMRKRWKTGRAFGDYRIEHEGHEATFVGPIDLVDLGVVFFGDQLLETPTWRLKERTGINRVYGTRVPLLGDDSGSRPRAGMFDKTIGWWCIDKTLPFCLFKEHTDALKWLELL